MRQRIATTYLSLLLVCLKRQTTYQYPWYLLSGVRGIKDSLISQYLRQKGLDL
jgi:hypothetical protein